jgi:hypothetical protein
MKVRVARAKADIGFEGGKTIGLHVRHGDACTPAEEKRARRKCEDLHVYMPRGECVLDFNLEWRETPLCA